MKLFTYWNLFRYPAQHVYPDMINIYPGRYIRHTDINYHNPRVHSNIYTQRVRACAHKRIRLHARDVSCCGQDCTRAEIWMYRGVEYPCIGAWTAAKNSRRTAVQNSTGPSTMQRLTEHQRGHCRGISIVMGHCNWVMWWGIVMGHCRRAL